MQSPSNPQDVDSKEIGIVPEHEELVGYVYRRVVREVLARIDQRLAELEKHAAPDPAEARASKSRWRTGFGIRLNKWAVYGAIGLVLGAGIAGAAAAWRSSDAEAARILVARFMPQFVSDLLGPKDDQQAPADADTPAVQQAAAPAAAPLQATVANQSPPDDVGRDTDGQAAAPPAPDVAPLLEKMARDIESLTQQMEQLKLSQDQMSRDNATAVQQLQAGQDQLVRIIKPTTGAAPAPKPAVSQQRATAGRPPHKPPPPASFLFRRPS